MPAPSAAQLAALLHPESSTGHIAKGRWLWSQGNSQAAEAELQLALAQARQRNLTYRMLLASEPLVELLLERGETAAAAQVLAELQAHDPERLDQSYQLNLLKLRVALAQNQKPAIIAAYERTNSLAGERNLPMPVLLAYEKSVRSVDRPVSVQSVGLLK